MKVGLEILSENNRETCDRCKSIEWARIGLTFTPSLGDDVSIEFPKGETNAAIRGRVLRVIMCIDCLAHAIQSVTGWNIRSLLHRYRTISPLYGTQNVNDEYANVDEEITALSKKYKGIKPKPTKKKRK